MTGTSCTVIGVRMEKAPWPRGRGLQTMKQHPTDGVPIPTLEELELEVEIKARELPGAVCKSACTNSLTGTTGVSTRTDAARTPCASRMRRGMIESG